MPPLALLLLLLVHGDTKTVQQDKLAGVRTVDVQAVEGMVAQFPCDLGTAANDKVYMVFWFRDDAGIPLYRLKDKWIIFPGNEESRRIVARGFEEAYGLPSLLGTIDCTQVKIFPPPLPYSVQYLNRKGVHSLNVQLIADVNCKILAVNARFPGRVHDSFIFNNSSIKDELKRLYEGHIGEYFLLGDSGYALEPWLMTPVLNTAPNSPEARYTAWHCRVRNTIERTNGYLKNVFRCLGHDRVLRYSPAKASAIINTCCVLYNIMQHYRNLPIDEMDAEMVEGAPQDHQQHYPQNGLLLRVAQQKEHI